MCKHKSQAGMSLIEIMVAVTLSLVLMAGVLSIMINSKKTYVMQEQLAKLQENARFIMDDMSYSLRMAGFYGCRGKTGLSANLLTQLVGVVRIAGNNNQAIREANEKPPNSNETGDYGFVTLSESQTPSRPKVVGGNGFPTSDTLQVTYFGPEIENAITGDLPPLTSSLVMAPNSIFGLQANSLIIISSCSGSDVATVGSIGTDQINLSPVTESGFAWPIQVFAGASPVRYEVRGIDNNADHDAQDPEDGFAIFRTDTTEPTQFLRRFVDGVQNLQVRYGVDTDNDGVANIYIDDINNATNPQGSVVSVRISLLMRTTEKRYDIEETTNINGGFNLNQTTYNPSDNLNYEKGYRHRFFTTVVKLRNT